MELIISSVVGVFVLVVLVVASVKAMKHEGTKDYFKNNYNS